MRFVVLIPARLASSRLPRKALADLGGAPMIVRVAQRAAASRAARVVVAADDDEIVAACAAHGVAGKCTAGLHHPLRGEHALTYEPGCARGTMYGFVNVFLAAALLRAGHAPAGVRPLLEERDPAAFAFDDAGASWRGMRVDVGTIADARAHGAVSFGSCSFDEPVRDLQTLGWWPGEP